jgi:hypothetical protein
MMNRTRFLSLTIQLYTAALVTAILFSTIS